MLSFHQYLNLLSVLLEKRRRRQSRLDDSAIQAAIGGVGEKEKRCGIESYFCRKEDSLVYHVCSGSGFCYYYLTYRIIHIAYVLTISPSLSALTSTIPIHPTHPHPHLPLVRPATTSNLPDDSFAMSLRTTNFCAINLRTTNVSAFSPLSIAGFWP